jgi:peptidoglycan hydrolase CwlO-like protein
LKEFNDYHIKQMSLINQINELKLLIGQAEEEVKSLESGKKASSARGRKVLQSIKGNCHALRKSITETTKALPTKTRTKKVPVEEAPAEAPAEAPSVEVEPVEPAEPVKEKKSRKKPSKDKTV